MDKRRFVLTVAVSRYAARSMPALPGVVTDAENLRRTLRDHADGGVHREVPLNDGQATRQGILNAFETVAREARATDQVILYFGGHGHREMDSASGHWKYYFLCYDASWDTAATHGLSTTDLRDAVGQLHASELVVIFDCCHSGGIGGFQWTNQALHDSLDGWRDHYVMASTRGLGQGIDTDQGGLFVGAFCQALRGEAGTPEPDGRVSAHQAWMHARQALTEAAARYGHAQESVYNGAGGLIYLTRPDRHAKGRDFDVVIPVGPWAVDRQKMPKLEGLKPAAKVVVGGREKYVLRHLLDCLLPIEGRIRFVYLLLKRGQGTSRRRLDACVPAGHSLRSRLVFRGDESCSCMKALCDLRNSLTEQFLLHYNDVWPDDPTMYGQLLQAAEDVPHAYSTPGHPYGGTLACAIRPPRNFQLLVESIQEQRNFQDQHLRMAKSAAKPFHLLKAMVVERNQFLHRYLVNMAIAFLRKEVLQTIADSNDYAAHSKSEFFQILSDSLVASYCFPVHPYPGEWTHCDDEDDLDFINSRSPLTTRS